MRFWIDYLNAVKLHADKSLPSTVKISEKCIKQDPTIFFINTIVYFCLLAVLGRKTYDSQSDGYFGLSLVFFVIELFTFTDVTAVILL